MNPQLASQSACSKNAAIVREGFHRIGACLVRDYERLVAAFQASKAAIERFRAACTASSSWRAVASSKWPVRLCSASAKLARASAACAFTSSAGGARGPPARAAGSALVSLVASLRPSQCSHHKKLKASVQEDTLARLVRNRYGLRSKIVAEHIRRESTGARRSGRARWYGRRSSLRTAPAL